MDEEKAEAVTEKKGSESVVSAFDTQDELFDDVTQR